MFMDLSLGTSDRKDTRTHEKTRSGDADGHETLSDPTE